ncbi:hypothetical protein K474DRAFT_474447 [Panus rudis PR-1116 ss-1]|nr:hypothetical protein K474DRAFT_474447 [Panus rudis PR-1116 ss-1]
MTDLVPSSSGGTPTNTHIDLPAMSELSLGTEEHHDHKHRPHSPRPLVLKLFSPSGSNSNDNGESPIVSIINHRRHLNTLIPIFSLPPELLTDIFTFLLPQTHGEDRDLSNPYDWIRSCTHVCWRWRDIACSRPTLWRTIVANKQNVSERYIETMLARSSNIPFEFIAELNPPDGDNAFFKLILAEAHRLRKVHIRGGLHPLLQITGMMRRSFPMLEDLVLEDAKTFGRITDHVFPSQVEAPSLERLSVHGSSLSRKDSPLYTFTSLRHLDAAQYRSISEMRNMLNALKHLPHLETLRLIPISPRFRVIATNIQGEPEEPPPIDVTLPNLKHLSLSLSLTYDISFFKSLIHPSGTRYKLSIHAGWESQSMEFPNLAFKAISDKLSGAAKIMGDPMDLSAVHLCHSDDGVSVLQLYRDTETLEEMETTSPQAQTQTQINPIEIILDFTRIWTIPKAEPVDLAWKALPMNKVHTLVCAGFVLRAGETSWIQLKNQMSGIETLRVSVSMIESLSRMLSISGSSIGLGSRTISLPRLRTLVIYGDGTYERSRKKLPCSYLQLVLAGLRVPLRERLNAGVKLDKLRVQGVEEFGRLEADMLRSLVKEIVLENKEGSPGTSPGWGPSLKAVVVQEKEAVGFRNHSPLIASRAAP